MSTLPILFFSNKDDQDYFHLSNFSVPDKIWCLHLQDKTVLVVSSLEYSRAKSQTTCEVLALSELQS